MGLVRGTGVGGGVRGAWWRVRECLAWLRVAGTQQKPRKRSFANRASEACSRAEGTAVISVRVFQENHCDL